jgi:hypothetical protein
MGFMGKKIGTMELQKSLKKFTISFFNWFVIEFMMTNLFPTYIWLSNIIRSMVGDYELKEITFMFEIEYFWTKDVKYFILHDFVKDNSNFIPCLVIIYKI